MDRPLSRVMPCDRCGHDEHILRCEATVVDGVLCPCRDVPVPGIYSAYKGDPDGWRPRSERAGVYPEVPKEAS